MAGGHVLAAVAILAMACLRGLSDVFMPAQEAPSPATPVALVQPIQLDASATPSTGAVEPPFPSISGLLIRTALSESHAVNNDTCHFEVQQKYHCEEPGCEELTAGYINYISFLQCTIPNAFARVLACLMLVVWMLFLLHLVEGTTNDYFVEALQLAVAILKLTPNVAGVTFLAVGNAACDVIASIAAIATGATEVGVGTTVGAGIFVTTACVAAVSFVSDVRLPRRSFLRDMLFFMFTVVYLLVCTLDKYIDLKEAIGFIIIYIVFVAVVAGGRYFRKLLRGKNASALPDDDEEDEEGEGSTSQGKGAAGDKAGALAIANADGGFNSGSGSYDASAVAAAAAGGAAASAAAANAATAGRPPISAQGRSISFAPTSSGRPMIGDMGRSSSFAPVASASGGSFYGAGAGGDILSALQAARREALDKKSLRELEALSRNKKVFAQGDAEAGSYGSGDESSSGSESDEAEGDGDLGSGSGVGKVRTLTASQLDEEGNPLTPGGSRKSGNGRSPAGRGASHSFVDDLPSKPKKWTQAFKATQGGNAAFSMPKYHRQQLVKKLTDRLAARGIHHMVTTADGRRVDIAELALTDPQGAADLLATAASAITAKAIKQGKALTYGQAAAVAGEAARRESSGDGFGAALDGGYHSVDGEGDGGGSGAGGSGAGDATVPVDDLLAVLPKETIKPVAKMYERFHRVLTTVGPYYHAFMHTLERPVTVARHLTIPQLQEGVYHRRMVLLNMPFSFAMLAILMTTAVLKGSSTEIGGFPVFLIAAIFGAAFSVVLHFFVLPSSRNVALEGGEKVSLLAAASKTNSGAATALVSDPATTGALAPVVPKEGATAAPTGEHQHHHHHHHHTHWYTPVVKFVRGPAHDPVPKGPVFVLLLVLSFVMALMWLLVIANELVGTALAFGKVLSVPDVVMGLAVLAVGNSVNDMAASITIAREGLPAMAVAGAYAGPMFNVLAGIGLPMLVACVQNGEGRAYIGGGMPSEAPLVWMAFFILLTSLTVTIIWVPLSGFRITHRIGRFLMFWFFLFIGLVIIMGSVPSIAATASESTAD